MTRYYCPYCLPREEVYIKDKHANIICSSCGESLIEIKIIKPRQIVATVLASAFLMPLFLMTYVYFYDGNDSESNEPLSPVGFYISNHVKV